LTPRRRCKTIAPDLRAKADGTSARSAGRGRARRAALAAAVLALTAAPVAFAAETGLDGWTNGAAGTAFRYDGYVRGLALAQTLPPPVAGKTVNLKLLSGSVRYRIPGAASSTRLTEDVQVPIGTTLDTLAGRVSITAASDLHGGTNKSWFYSGVFTIGQAVAAKPVTELRLAGAEPSCGKASASAAKKKTRKLWGDGSGQFRTRGQFSSATVRGTKWVVIDRCDGTLTRVVRGVVSVRDFAKRKTILLRAGERYLARKSK
jgi:hypothetical protein